MRSSFRREQSANHASRAETLRACVAALATSRKRGGLQREGGEPWASSGRLRRRLCPNLFSGTAGGQARVTMTRTSGSLAPKFRVYRPDGTELCTAQSGSTAQILCVLDATGTYSILAGDQSGTLTGNYTLSLQPN